MSDVDRSQSEFRPRCLPNAGRLGHTPSDRLGHDLVQNGGREFSPVQFLQCLRCQPACGCFFAHAETGRNQEGYAPEYRGDARVRDQCVYRTARRESESIECVVAPGGERSSTDRDGNRTVYPRAAAAVAGSSFFARMPVVGNQIVWFGADRPEPGDRRSRHHSRRRCGARSGWAS